MAAYDYEGWCFGILQPDSAREAKQETNPVHVAFEEPVATGYMSPVTSIRNK